MVREGGGILIAATDLQDRRREQQKWETIKQRQEVMDTKYENLAGATVISGSCCRLSFDCVSAPVHIFVQPLPGLQADVANSLIC